MPDHVEITITAKDAAGSQHSYHAEYRPRQPGGPEQAVNEIVRGLSQDVADRINTVRDDG